LRQTVDSLKGGGNIPNWSFSLPIVLNYCHHGLYYLWLCYFQVYTIYDFVISKFTAIMIVIRYFVLNKVWNMINVFRLCKYENIWNIENIFSNRYPYMVLYSWEKRNGWTKISNDYYASRNLQPLIEFKMIYSILVSCSIVGYIQICRLELTVYNFNAVELFLYYLLFVRYLKMENLVSYRPHKKYIFRNKQYEIIVKVYDRLCLRNCSLQLILNKC